MADIGIIKRNSSMSLADLAARLLNLDRCQWHVHETELCRRLKMKHQEALSICSQLSELLAALGKGHKGNDQKGTFESTGCDAVDLGQTGVPNSFGIHFVFHGPAESFVSHSLAQQSKVVHQPRWFSIGQPMTSITRQLQLLHHVTGQGMVELDEATRKRRQEIWHAWHDKDKERGAVEYERKDLLDIARQFWDCWRRVPALGGSLCDISLVELL